jgi:hypothetical protein
MQRGFELDVDVRHHALGRISGTGGVESFQERFVYCSEPVQANSRHLWRNCGCRFEWRGERRLQAGIAGDNLGGSYTDPNSNPNPHSNPDADPNPNADAHPITGPGSDS